MPARNAVKDGKIKKIHGLLVELGEAEGNGDD
jgi:hypothetical protein